MADIADRRNAIESSGTQLAFVHMGEEAEAGALFQLFNLGDVARVSDPAARIYEAFGLKRGSFRQVLGPKVWWRALQSLRAGHRQGKLIGDGFRMPGVFLIRDGRIIKTYRHETVSDRPNYESVACEIG